MPFTFPPEWRSPSPEYAMNRQMSGCEPSTSVKPYSRASCPELTDLCFHLARLGSAANTAAARPPLEQRTIERNGAQSHRASITGEPGCASCDPKTEAAPSGAQPLRG